jgi:hypothetical protein
MSNNTTTGDIVALDKDQPVPFTYPDGFQAVINSLEFLPEEAREQTLAALVVVILTQ